MKLFKIEWLKLSRHNFFWIGMGLYLICIVLIITQIGAFRFKTEEGGLQLQSLQELGIYRIDSLWRHMTYMTAFFKIIPAFLLVFFLSNEFRYRTFRQNIIDGLSVGEVYLSKVMSAILFTLLSLATVLTTGLILGLIHNPQAELSAYFKGVDFFLAYFAELFCIMTFAIFLTVLFKRSTITVIILLLYYYVIENIISIKFGAPTIYFFPLAPSRELNLQPFTSLVPILAGQQQENATLPSVPIKYLSLTIFYSLLMISGGYLILKKRDL